VKPDIAVAQLKTRVEAFRVHKGIFMPTKYFNYSFAWPIHLALLPPDWMAIESAPASMRKASAHAFDACPWWCE